MPMKSAFIPFGLDLKRSARIPAVLLGLLICGVSASGAGITPWAGQGSTGLWSDNLNWFGGAPIAGSGASFGAGLPRPINTNDLATSRFWSTVRIDGSNYVIHGNALHLTNGFSADYLGGSSTFDPDISIFSFNQLPSVLRSNSTLIMNGNIVLTNSADLTFDGPGPLRLFANLIRRA